MKMDGNWQRVMMKSHCSAQSCMLRMDKDKQQHLQHEYWHVSFMEAGTIKCVSLCQLVLVTTEIASVSPMARLYFLRRVHLKDDNTISAKVCMEGNMYCCYLVDVVLLSKLNLMKKNSKGRSLHLS